SRREVAEFEMRLDREDPTPRFRGRVNERPAMLLYDSGSSGSLAISGRAVGTLGLEGAFAAAQPHSAFSDGGRARTPARRGRVGLAEIGGLRYPVVRCPSGGRRFGALTATAMGLGKVGTALLEDAIVTLDYRRHRMRFER